MSRQASALTRVQRLLGPARAIDGRAADEAVAAYGVDQSGLGPCPPDVVALPDSAQEVAEILRLAALDRIPVTPRGLGSGKTGGALAVDGGILVSTERMHRVREIDEGDLVAVVEPGVVTGVLHQQVQARRLFYPPDPASCDICSIGGNVAENAGGPRAFKYGVTRDFTLGLDLALIGGERLRLGRRAPKGVTGLDLVALLVGSEGTLGVITEISLRLLPLPAQEGTFIAAFVDAASAGRGAQRMLREGLRPRAIELLDERVVEHVRAAAAGAAAADAVSLPAGGRAALLVELDGGWQGGAGEQVAAETLAAAGACEAAGAVEVLVATDAAHRERMWQMRRGISKLLGSGHRHKASEDVAVPLSAIPSMLQALDSLAVRHGLIIAAYGHAGDGNLHVNLLWDDERPAEALDAVREAVFRAALALGGTLSGEHGIGLTKRRFVPLEQSAALLRLQRKLKQAFDPLGLMNPHKLL